MVCDKIYIVALNISFLLLVIQGNAIYHANTPVMDAFAKNTDQYITLDASGLSVGLPDGLMGNSEVGHLNIGAGRVIYQVL